jgi:hypothetical protein
MSETVQNATTTETKPTKKKATKPAAKPKAAKNTDKMYKWTWDNLKTLIGGGR